MKQLLILISIIVFTTSCNDRITSRPRLFKSGFSITGCKNKTMSQYKAYKKKRRNLNKKQLKVKR